MTNAAGGSQRHDRQTAISVVPTTVVPRKASVTMFAGAPMIGGAAATASRPKIANISERARTAIAAAPTASMNEPASAHSGGYRLYKRVPAKSDSDTTPRPTATST
jgi:hypothetical protein